MNYTYFATIGIKTRKHGTLTESSENSSLRGSKPSSSMRKNPKRYRDKSRSSHGSHHDRSSPTKKNASNNGAPKSQTYAYNTSVREKGMSEPRTQNENLRYSTHLTSHPHPKLTSVLNHSQEYAIAHNPMYRTSYDSAVLSTLPRQSSQEIPKSTKSSKSRKGQPN